MTRYLLAALMLSACSCSTAPIAPDAQRQLEAIEASYSGAHAAVVAYGALPACPWTQPCADTLKADDARRADYNASAAIVTADQERTAEAMANADRATKRLVSLAGGLW